VQKKYRFQRFTPAGAAACAATGTSRFDGEARDKAAFLLNGECVSWGNPTIRRMNSRLDWLIATIAVVALVAGLIALLLWI
jgi:hypothetical protein